MTMTWQSFKDGMKLRWKTFKEDCKLSYKINSKDFHFYLKLVVFLLTFVNVLMWNTNLNPSGLALKGPYQRALYDFTVPPHLLILGGVLLMYVCLRRPSQLFERLYLFPAILLFGSVAVLSVINCIVDPELGWVPILLGVVCVLITCIMMVDYIVAELVDELKTELAAKQGTL